MRTWMLLVVVGVGNLITELGLRRGLELLEGCMINFLLVVQSERDLMDSWFADGLFSMTGFFLYFSAQHR